MGNWKIRVIRWSCKNKWNHGIKGSYSLIMIWVLRKRISNNPQSIWLENLNAWWREMTYRKRTHNLYWSSSRKRQDLKQRNLWFKKHVIVPCKYNWRVRTNSNKRGWDHETRDLESLDWIWFQRKILYCWNKTICPKDSNSP